MCQLVIQELFEAYHHRGYREAKGRFYFKKVVENYFRGGLVLISILKIKKKKYHGFKIFLIQLSQS